MLSHVDISALVLLLSAFLLAAFFAHVYQQKRQKYLLAWALGWLLISVHYIGPAFLPDNSFPGWLIPLNGLTMALVSVAFLAAARMYARLDVNAPLIVAMAGASALWSYAYWKAVDPALTGIGVGLVLFVVAYTFWQEGRKQESRADELLALTFFVWGWCELRWRCSPCCISGTAWN